MSNYKSDDLERRAQQFKALSNPHRLQLFLKLATACAPGQCCSREAMRTCVGSLSENMGLAPSTISHHLKELRQAQLIHMQRSGKQVECWVNQTMVDEVTRFFQSVGTPAGE
uniref:Putative ArsR family transcriptional regulator n=1 Tax=Magnetococcus massalia (strain MO-1) TaxID=451514 RepID=A0A1S7LCT6_MAGMO|nr:Putative ArsR family transcriptional regulator [Candidatus Magnetococcus massalia]